MYSLIAIMLHSVYVKPVGVSGLYSWVPVNNEVLAIPVFLHSLTTPTAINRKPKHFSNLTMIAIIATRRKCY